METYSSSLIVLSFNLLLTAHSSRWHWQSEWAILSISSLRIIIYKAKLGWEPLSNLCLTLFPTSGRQFGNPAISLYLRCGFCSESKQLEVKRVQLDYPLWFICHVTRFALSPFSWRNRLHRPYWWHQNFKFWMRKKTSLTRMAQVSVRTDEWQMARWI